MIHIYLVNIPSRNRSSRVDSDRECALERTCARARSIERGHSAVWSAQDSVRHITSVNGSCGNRPSGIEAKTGKNKGALAGACAGVRSIKRSDGAVRSAQETVSYIASVNVASRDRPSPD